MPSNTTSDHTELSCGRANSEASPAVVCATGNGSDNAAESDSDSDGGNDSDSAASAAMSEAKGTEPEEIDVDVLFTDQVREWKTTCNPKQLKQYEEKLRFIKAFAFQALHDGNCNTNSSRHKKLRYNSFSKLNLWRTKRNKGCV